MRKAKAYYNEFKPSAAAWLRELIADGVIAGGDVDERSITEVQPEDLNGYTQVHFFAGIGGWSRALRLAGWPDELPVWTGSCPCQPFSVAGKKKGASDHRHLWPEFRRLIERRKPSVAFGEQVASADGRLWLAGVRTDLETLGYEVGGSDLCSAGVGSPNIRQRIYWVADAIDGGFKVGWPEADGALRAPSGLWPQTSNQRAETSKSGYGSCWVGDADSERRNRESIRLQPRESFEDRIEVTGDGSDGRVDISKINGQQGREQLHGEHNREVIASGCDLGAWSDFIVLYCKDGKLRRSPVEPELFPLATRLPFMLDDRRDARTALLEGGGNAINPYVAAEFIMAFMEAAA